jgi:hypothetical protein
MRLPTGIEHPHQLWRSHNSNPRGYHGDDEDVLTFDADERTLMPNVSQGLSGSSDVAIQMLASLGIMKSVAVHQSGSISE